MRNIIVEVSHFMYTKLTFTKNIPVLSYSFIGLRLIDPLCHWTFGDTWESVKDTDCELDMRESEILFFLLIAIMVR